MDEFNNKDFLKYITKTNIPCWSFRNAKVQIIIIPLIIRLNLLFCF